MESNLMRRRLPKLPPRKPKSPLMRFARPAMREMIERLEKMLENTEDKKLRDLLNESREWPTSAYGLSKEEVKVIKQRAGELLFRFNSEYAGKDRITY